MFKRTAVYAALAVAAALGLSGYSLPPSTSGVEREDCDREDLRKFERDCGY